ncbi:MAG: TNT domain-containing protein [Ruminococcus sp.]|nr:TNT domain-containing protein [Ruminococcus sp.]
MKSSERNKNDNAYHVYYVNEDFEVTSTIANAAFGYPDEGTQYELDPVPINRYQNKKKYDIIK